MSTKPDNISRRNAILATLKAAAAACLTTPLAAGQTPQRAAPSTAEFFREEAFIPENDYPFFGGELPEGYCIIRSPCRVDDGLSML